MSTEARHRRIREDLDLIERFGRTYRERFARVIRDLNAPAPSPQAAGESLRLCVETLDMLLSTQGALALALRELAGPAAQPAAGIAPRALRVA